MVCQTYHPLITRITTREFEEEDLHFKFPGAGRLEASILARPGLCRAGAAMPGRPGYAGQVRRNFGQLSPHRTTGKIFSRLSSKPTTSTFFLLGRISTLGSAGGYAGQARPGFYAGQARQSAKPYDRMIRMIRMTRRAGVSGKNMFIRHVLRHVEIKRFWWLGAAVPLSVEGVFQMAYIVPERLLALVRPAFDLVLRRIRSLKRCVEA